MGQRGPSHLRKFNSLPETILIISRSLTVLLFCSFMTKSSLEGFYRNWAWISLNGNQVLGNFSDPGYLILSIPYSSPSHNTRRGQEILFWMVDTSDVNKGFVTVHNLHLSTQSDNTEDHLPPKYTRSILCIS